MLRRESKAGISLVSPLYLLSPLPRREGRAVTLPLADNPRILYVVFLSRPGTADDTICHADLQRQS